jgi:predicted phosphodiesterase
MRVFALSDVHVDYKENMSWLQALSPLDYIDDTLILAGDVSDDLKKLQAALACVRTKFAQVFFVPGNHELWIRQGDYIDSMAKFWRVLELCAALGIKTSPAKVGATPGDKGIWVVPLFSWYMKPEEGGGSLFVQKEGEDPTLEMWADNYFTKWPPLQEGLTVADAFLRLNEKYIRQPYDAPVISFSHFLPRMELIFPPQEEDGATGKAVTDAHPHFNFSRVAGYTGIEEQIRRLGSVVHVYGHQHRNRHWRINDVLYISHCLGYPHESENGYTCDRGRGPKLIWRTHQPSPTVISKDKSV